MKPSAAVKPSAPVKPLAPRLAEVVEGYLGGMPVRLRAWDGSEAGPAVAPTVVLRSPRALRRLLWQPGELGLAQAYIAGDLDIEGDLTTGLSAVWRAVRDRGPGPHRKVPHRRLAAALTALRCGAIGPRPPAPGARQARLRGRPHTTDRDRAAISHHYDLSNDWYALLLDESMAYSCAYWTRPDDPHYGLAEAQHDKLELICRKLALAPGTRLLDVGCGWGSLSLHAAQHFGARVTAVTLSREQRDFVAARVRERGLDDLVKVHLRHYRDITGADYDAVCAIEMGEHVGAAQYPAFAGRLHALLRPGGRLLVQQMSRTGTAPGGGAFIESYIAPDMHMRPLGDTVSLLENAGLDVWAVESLREHYVRTIAAWYATLEGRWADFVALAGVETARVWRLYLAGGGLAFAERRMGVDQILAVRPGTDDVASMPATLHDWYRPRETR
ncbi:SAM-dependent methyltransferase [Streptomyces xanthochromogenes]|uniref:SAM-dependent methyltransferase n=1 Tax=Streptomyces xanthochromogenes TaxID=67384 RepID=UPI0016788A64|nr:cyclopropane-fatty-acyl-phospholipid synthase family protein [Streptomyces xanthochromogenes]